MREIVAARDTIFNEQRQFSGGESCSHRRIRGGADLGFRSTDQHQQAPLQLAQQYIDSFVKIPDQPSPIASSFAIWQRFCTEQDVPSFPITPSLVAFSIWRLTIKSQKVVDLYPFVLVLSGIWKETSIWKGQNGAEEVQGSLLQFDAIAEFLDERRAKLNLTAGQMWRSPLLVVADWSSPDLQDRFNALLCSQALISDPRGTLRHLNLL